MSQDKTDLYSAMYNTDADDDDAAPKNSALGEKPPVQNAKTRKIRVGIVEYDVPTVEYVGRLEALVVAQAQQIQNLLREMRRVEHSMQRLWRQKPPALRGAPEPMLDI